MHAGCFPVWRAILRESAGQSAPQNFGSSWPATVPTVRQRQIGLIQRVLRLPNKFASGISKRPLYQAEINRKMSHSGEKIRRNDATVPGFKASQQNLGHSDGVDTMLNSKFLTIFLPCIVFIICTHLLLKIGQRPSAFSNPQNYRSRYDPVNFSVNFSCNPQPVVAR